MELTARVKLDLSGEAETLAPIVRSALRYLAAQSYPQGRTGKARFRKQFLDYLRKDGWAMNARLDSISRITVTAVSGRAALSFQTGNMGRFYADLLKLQYLFVRKKVDSCVLVVLGEQEGKEIDSNLASFERTAREFELFSTFLTMPLLIVGLRKG